MWLNEFQSLLISYCTTKVQYLTETLVTDYLTVLESIDMTLFLLLCTYYYCTDLLSSNLDDYRNNFIQNQQILTDHSLMIFFPHRPVAVTCIKPRRSSASMSFDGHVVIKTFIWNSQAAKIITFLLQICICCCHRHYMIPLFPSRVFRLSDWTWTKSTHSFSAEVLRSDVAPG